MRYDKTDYDQFHQLNIHVTLCVKEALIIVTMNELVMLMYIYASNPICITIFGGIEKYFIAY